MDVHILLLLLIFTISVNANTALVNDIRTIVHTLQEKVQLQARQSGAVFIRFGSANCPNTGTEQVYAGIAGGSHFTHKGAAVDYLCLPTDPDWYQTTEGNQVLSAHVYGAEYETDYQNSPFGRSHQNYGVPCTVCRTIGRSSKYMVPGKNRCASGWTLEYSGYLMTGFPEHYAASEYVCVDKDANVTGSNTDIDGKLFYSVEAQCGSLPCPPYVQGFEMTCAVCTK